MDGVYKTHEGKKMLGVLQRTGTQALSYPGVPGPEAGCHGRPQGQGPFVVFIFFQIAPSVRELPLGDRGSSEPGNPEGAPVAEAMGAHRYSEATVQKLQGHKALHLKEGSLSDRIDEK